MNPWNENMKYRRSGPAKAPTPEKQVNPDNIPESAIQRQIKQLLNFYSFMVWKNQQGPLSYPGVSDLTAIKKGNVYWIEVKKPTGKLSKDQIKFQQDVKDHGGIYLVLRSFEEAEKFVESLNE